MLPKSANYNTIFSDPSHYAEIKLLIDGTYYDEASIMSLSTHNSLMGEWYTLGNVIINQFEATLIGLSQNDVTRYSEVDLFVRYSDGTNVTNWLPKGKYIVAEVNYDTESGMMSIMGYDYLCKTEVIPYPQGDTIINSWTNETMRTVANRMATLLGVSLEDDTQVSEETYPAPPFDYTMREILADIGLIGVGNWYLTYVNSGNETNPVATPKLRLWHTTDGGTTTALGRNVTSFEELSPTDGVNEVEIVYGYNSDGVKLVKTATGTGSVDVSYEIKSFANGYNYKTATGTIVTINDAIAYPVKDLSVKVDFTQDLHGYDNPYPDGGGKNILNYDKWKTVSIMNGTAVWENNGVTLTATANDCYTSYNNSAFPQKARVPIAEGETITLAWEETTNTSGAVYIFPNGGTTGMVSVNNANAKKVSYTATSGVTYVAFRFGVNTSGNTISYKNIQIVKGTTVPTWSPYSNICPIVGHTEANVTRAGKNLFELPNTIEQGNFDESGLNTNNSMRLRTSNYIPVNVGDVVKVTWQSASVTRFALSGYATNDFTTARIQSTSWLTKGDTVTIASGVNYIRLNFNSTTAQVVLTPTDISSLVVANNESITTITIPFNDTIYKGTLDVTSGVLTVKEVLYQAKWKNGTSATVLGDNTRKAFATGFVANYPNYTNKPISNIALYKANWGEDSIHFYVNSAVNTNNAFVYLPNNTDDETDIQICYELATPIEVTLTPTEVSTLLGTNNIWADTGDTTVEYSYGDTMQVIADKLAQNYLPSTYQPFTATGVELDMACELGDIVSCNSHTAIFGDIDTEWNKGMWSDISSPTIEQYDEFMYTPQAQRTAQRVERDTATNTAKIEVNSDSIQAEVTRATTAESDMNESLRSTITQTASDVTIALQSYAQDQVNNHAVEQQQYIRYSASGLELGESGNNTKAKLTTTALEFYDPTNAKKAYIGADPLDNNVYKFFVENGHIGKENTSEGILEFGQHWLVVASGSDNDYRLTFKWKA